MWYNNAGQVTTKYAKADLKNFLFETRIEAWYQNKAIKVKKGDLSASYTKELRRYIDKYYEPFFKSMDIREVRTGHIDDFYSSLPEHLSTKTVKNILNALQNFFLEMYRKEYIPRCPQFPVITAPEPEWCWIDEKTQNALIEAIPVQHSPIYTFMARQARCDQVRLEPYNGKI